MKKRILVVDDQLAIRRGIGQLLRMRFDVLEAADVAAALAKLDAEPVDLVLTDLKLPDGTGLTVLEKSLARDAELPVIIMTAYASVENAVEAIRAGARDFMLKPFPVDELEAKIGRALEEANLRAENRDLRAEVRTQYETIKTLALTIDAKDPYTRGHSERVTRLSLDLGRHLMLPAAQIKQLRYAGILHDIGKLGISDAILGKPGKLTEEEYRAIKDHPVIGERIIQPIEFLAELRPVIRHHHETYDGAGYPDGLTGERIPFLARLVAIADAFDAMTSERAYRKALPLEKAVAELEHCAGRQFDPGLIPAFVELVSDHRYFYLLKREN